FTPHRFTVETETKMALCNCKHTHNPPRCDGTHSSLPPSEE
ncbi:MAG: CDGSH iron-sulfur domain-containing protein, partial [Cyanobacteria bacterium HKST-UBA01]|nr:CDGSH iron-sulfur domain-containing protein [Cyanobacteria bacterium HKST-UBA01]